MVRLSLSQWAVREKNGLCLLSAQQRDQQLDVDGNAAPWRSSPDLLQANRSCCKARKRSTTVDESASSSDDRTEVIEHLALRSDWASS